MNEATSFEHLVRARRSARRFRPGRIPADQLRAILEDARHTPSNSNTQPWNVHIVSGPTLQHLGDELVAAYDQGRPSPDFTLDYGDGAYQQRAQQFGAVHYTTWGIARADKERSGDVVRDNLRFYGAPHAALLFMPRLGDNVRTAGDIGMYAQTFLLSLTARGYAGIPQAVLGQYAGTIREVLGVPDDLALSFGISFGVPDNSSPLRSLDIERAALADTVVVHDTPGVNEGH